MKITLAAVTVALALVVGLASPALADDTPTPDPTSTAPAELEPWSYDEYPDSDDRSSWVLDCERAEWLAPVVHYFAAQAAPGVYDEPTVWTTIESMGAATGDSIDSDCPNWVTDDEGTWRDSNLDPAPIIEDLPEALPLDPVLDDAAKLGLAIEWKLGLA